MHKKQQNFGITPSIQRQIIIGSGKTKTRALSKRGPRTLNYVKLFYFQEFILKKLSKDFTKFFNNLGLRLLPNYKLVGLI